ncbi:glyceraldehyde 3-phosphate dehydrogenase NAD-binding domain-containing protein, partial [Microbacterium sp.]|uniref:glyceraldehyde 3-phosphate dehydrogenase NAD-binding domain-containing protein n=1 Tax=Microbacterium sp. TaxID=51671 RepID=UPI0037354FA4
MRREELAEALIPLIGRLYRDYGVVTSIHGHRLLNLPAIGIIAVHDRAAELGHHAVTLDHTLEVLQALLAAQPAPASIDIARVTLALTDENPDDLATLLAGITSPEHVRTDVVLYGFGRIGRLLARILIDHAGNGHGLRLRAIVVRRGSDNDLDKRASLLARDSVHGPFPGSITVDHENDVLVANGVRVQVIYSDDPSTVDYTAYGIKDAIVVDNTGRWRDREGLSQHLESKGVARVVLTAPGKGDLLNVVYGINHDMIGDNEIITAASCTTNGITPVLKVINDRYGVEHGHVETVHS